MNHTHYNYQKELETLWKRAVTQYEKGNRKPETYFNAEESHFLDSIGVNAQEVYDFAEDYVNYGEPDFTTFALIHDLRRSYFIEVQQRERSNQQIDPDSLPDRESEVAGIPYLPRIIKKAKAKLRGELHPDVMFSCPNDRRFLKTHDVHPAEFLRAVWMNGEDEEAIVQWFLKRLRSQASSSNTA